MFEVDSVCFRRIKASTNSPGTTTGLGGNYSDFSMVDWDYNYLVPSGKQT